MAIMRADEFGAVEGRYANELGAVNRHRHRSVWHWFGHSRRFMIKNDHVAPATLIGFYCNIHCYWFQELPTLTDNAVAQARWVLREMDHESAHYFWDRIVKIRSLRWNACAPLVSCANLSLIK